MHQNVIDPVLTQHARGWQQGGFVGGLLFPRVPVLARTGTVIQFGTEAFQLFNLRRAPGSHTRRVGFAYSGAAFKLVEDSVAVDVLEEYREDAKTTANLDLLLRATEFGMRIVTLGLEAEQAALATNLASYPSGNKVTLSGTSQWSHASSDPIKAVSDAIELVRSKTGSRPNVMVIGAKAWPALANHPAVVDRVKYTSKDSATPTILANLFGLEKIGIGDAVTADDAGAFTDVWGNVAILAFAPQVENGSREVPAFGYTYALSGTPSVRKTWFDNDRRSHVTAIDYERLPILTAPTAGYIFDAVKA